MSPLLADANIKGADGILINITGGNDLAMTEVQNIAQMIYENAGEDVFICKGVVIDESMEGKIKVTIVGTGLGKVKEPPKTVKIDEFVQKSSPEAISIIKKVEKIRKIDQGLRTVDDFNEEEFEIPTYLRKQAD
jgi:cell division protein FtsZ